MIASRQFWQLILTVTVCACGGNAPTGRATLPAKPAGCEVELFHGTPRGDTQNLGAVSATCGEDVEESECLRELKDQVCKLGGDVVWGVSDRPERVGEKNRYKGRAAVSK